MAKSLLETALERLGMQIVGGTLPEGHVVTIQQLEADLGVSHTVMREAVRVLQTLGMVNSVQRVGVRVLPAEVWNYFDPLIIKWRLAGASSVAQLRSLNELRAAIEPMAASLAAAHGPDELCATLLRLAGELRSVVRSGNYRRFVEVDVEFHSVLLAASGNEMFALLRGVLGKTVTGRSELGLLPGLPDERSLQLHVDLADAIQGRRPQDARALADQLACAINDELESTWRGTPRIFPSF